MILIESIALAIVLALLTGGRLRNLQTERLRGESLLVVLFPMQLLWPFMAATLGIDATLAVISWLFMMSALAVVLFANARARWMLAFAGLGIALNVFVIGLNGAMPVSLEATARVGMDASVAGEGLDRDLLHEELNAQTLAPALADVLPAVWQKEILSVGDLLLAGGLSMWVFSVCRRRETGTRT